MSLRRRFSDRMARPITPVGWVLAGMVAGFAIGAQMFRPSVPAADVGALQDSVAVAVAVAADAEAAAARALDRARADSIALAEIRRRVRVVPRPEPVPTPKDTAGGPVIVYEVPAPVAQLVERLERRVVGLEVAVDSATLSAQAERNARALAESLALAATRALQAEESKRWRYRLEGAGIVGVVGTLALLALAL